MILTYNRRKGNKPTIHVFWIRDDDLTNYRLSIEIIKYWYNNIKNNRSFFSNWIQRENSGNEMYPMKVTSNYSTVSFKLKQFDPIKHDTMFTFHSFIDFLF